MSVWGAADRLLTEQVQTKSVSKIRVPRPNRFREVGGASPRAAMLRQALTEREIEGLIARLQGGEART